MNSNLIKSNINSFKTISLYYISILILLVYGTYKNGYLLYRHGLTSFIGMFKPIILVILAIGITYLMDYIFNKNKYNNIFKESYNPIYIGLLTLTLPVNINIFNLLIIIFILNLLNNLIDIKNINLYCITKIIIILSMFLLGYYGYKNMYELNVDTAINGFDMFFGRSIGGIGTTNHFLLIICYTILFINPSYKRDIPLISLAAYTVMIIISLIFSNDIGTILYNLVNSEFLFGIIFIATIPNYSPIVLKDKHIYAIIIGIFSFLCDKYINPFEGVFIGIFVANMIMYIIYKIRGIKNEYK